MIFKYNNAALYKNIIYYIMYN